MFCVMRGCGRWLDTNIVVCTLKRDLKPVYERQAGMSCGNGFCDNGVGKVRLSLSVQCRDGRVGGGGSEWIFFIWQKAVFWNQGMKVTSPVVIKEGRDSINAWRAAPTGFILYWLLLNFVERFVIGHFPIFTKRNGLHYHKIRIDNKWATLTMSNSAE